MMLVVQNHTDNDERWKKAQEGRGRGINAGQEVQGSGSKVVWCKCTQMQSDGNADLSMVLIGSERGTPKVSRQSEDAE